MVAAEAGSVDIRLTLKLQTPKPETRGKKAE